MFTCTNTDKGFTLIEVVVYFGIAAVFAAVLFAGQQQTRDRARFSTAVDETRNMIESVKNETNATVNVRPTLFACPGTAGTPMGSSIPGLDGPGVMTYPGAGQDKNCMIFMRSLSFDNNQSQVTIHTYVAEKQLGDGPLQNIQEMEALSRTYTMPYEVRFVSSTAGNRHIVFARDHTDGGLRTYIMTASQLVSGNFNASLQQASYRLTSSDGSLLADIHVDSRSGAITREFDVED